MKRAVFFFFAVSLSFSFAHAQNDAWGYEYQYEIPTWVEQLQADLTYPLAWGHDKEKRFTKWKKKARAKVLECMMTPPPVPDTYAMTVLAEERRDGYTARKIEFALSRYYRVKAYLLVPDGKGPFPAINLLHDHGAHLSIGKEKMVKPFAVDSAVVKDAEDWVTDVFLATSWPSAVMWYSVPTPRYGVSVAGKKEWTATSTTSLRET